jgi:hypothetical protein
MGGRKHKERIKDEYGGSILYSCMKMRQSSLSKKERRGG